MAIPHAQPGEVIPLALGASLSTSTTTTLVKTANLELEPIREPRRLARR